MTTPLPVEERRARDLLSALRRMGPNGEGFDALLHAARRRSAPNR
jgi:hypothetical protein